MLKILSSYNKYVDKVVLGIASQNVKYILLEIQIEILSIFTRNFLSAIRNDIGDAKFCTIIYEVREEFKMNIWLLF